MNKQENEIKRWTTKRKTQVVVDILKGKMKSSDSHIVLGNCLKYHPRINVLAPLVS